MSFFNIQGGGYALYSHCQEREEERLSCLTRKKGNQFFQNVAERLNFRLLALRGTPASKLQLPGPQAKEREAGRSGGSREGWLVTGTTCTPTLPTKLVALVRSSGMGWREGFAGAMLQLKCHVGTPLVLSGLLDFLK